jgi:PA domain.
MTCIIMLKDHSLSRNNGLLGLLSILLLSSLGEHSCCQAVTPGAVIEIVSTNATAPIFFLASQAVFGPKLYFGKPGASHESSSPASVTLPPIDNPFLCDEPGDDDISILKDTIVIIPQGKCTYKTKVRNAGLLGARHAVIYNTLASKYHFTFEDPTSVENILYPSRYVDYECDNGAAWIPKDELKFNAFPYDTDNDKLLSGAKENGNLCALYHDVGSFGAKREFKNTCGSQRCVMTGRRKYDAKHQGTLVEACCAWDLHTLMGDDDSADDVYIPSIYLTMRQGEDLLNLLRDKGSLEAIVYARWYPAINVSIFVVCILASFTIWYSSWMGAKLYRDLWKSLLSETIEYDGENPPVRNVVTDVVNEDNGENSPESPEQMMTIESDTQDSSRREELQLATTTVSTDDRNEHEVTNNQRRSSAFLDGISTGNPCIIRH